MIIGFAGRKSSGKTELAKVAEKNGFKIVSFATPLKRLISDMLSISVEELNNRKEVQFDKPYEIDERASKILYEATDIDKDTIDCCFGTVKMNSIRDMLQFIGTNLIRTLRPEWHVKQAENEIEKYDNVVVDDLRFLNEKRMLEDHNARLFYVMRIGWTNVSQHISETDLRWRDFREQLLTGPDKQFQDAKAYIDQVSQSRNGFFESTVFKKSLNHVKEVDASDKDKWVVKYDDDTIETVINPYMMEDLKRFL